MSRANLPLARHLRPKLEIPVGALEFTIDGISSAVLGLTALTLLTSYGTVEPEAPIAIHYGLSGEPDNFIHDRRALLLYIAISGLLYFFNVFYAQAYPEKMNYPFPITRSNAKTQYTYALHMIRCLTFVICWAMYFLMMHTIDLANSLTKGTEHHHGIGENVVTLIVLPVFAILIVYFYKAYQAK